MNNELIDSRFCPLAKFLIDPRYVAIIIDTKVDVPAVSVGER